MTRVNGGGVATRNPFGPTFAGKAKGAEDLGQQVQQELFGKKKPKELDEDADTAAQMARLHAYKGKLARLAGDEDTDYSLTLAEGTIAMIDANGKIFVGRRFLLDHMDNVDLLVGVLAHEIGHRPKRWAEYKTQPQSRAELHELCRLEETYADFFAGRALAELGMNPEPICAFLEALEDGPHPEYFPAVVRGNVIREGFTDGKRKADTRKKMFPELAKRMSPKLDLGTG